MEIIIIGNDKKQKISIPRTPVALKITLNGKITYFQIKGSKIKKVWNKNIQKMINLLEAKG